MKPECAAPAPATQRVNKEAVRLLVIQEGVREAARIAGLNENTVLSWAHRYGWKTAIKTQSNGHSALVERVSDELEANGHATKLGLSKHAKHAITAINASVHPAKWTKEAHEIARTAALVHGWDKSDKDQAQVAVNIAILSS